MISAAEVFELTAIFFGSSVLAVTAALALAGVCVAAASFFRRWRRAVRFRRAQDALFLRRGRQWRVGP